MDASSQDTKELRGDAPADLVQALDALAQALDALAQADGQSRNAYVNKVLLAHVKERLHQISLGHRMLIGNPLYPESKRSKAE
jgi:hypothetical protein